MHRVASVRGLKAVAEIRGEWYVFTYGMGEGYVKATGASAFSPTTILFPTM